MNPFTPFEYQLLCAIASLEPNAYAVSLRRVLSPKPSLLMLLKIHSTASHLEKLGFLRSHEGERTLYRGWRPKLYWSLTPAGREAVARYAPPPPKEAPIELSSGTRLHPSLRWPDGRAIVTWRIFPDDIERPSAPDWVWSVEDFDLGDPCDGYYLTEDEALKAAKLAIEEESEPAPESEQSASPPPPQEKD